MTSGDREFRTQVRLRWRDLDVLGHLSHSVYHDLLEEARSGLLEEALPGLAHDSFVLAHVDMDYHAEILLGHGHIEAVARLLNTGTSSVTIGHEILRSDGVRAASGSSVLVAWDPVRRGKRILSTHERAGLGAAE